MTEVTVWMVGHNTCGYLPESSVNTFEDWEAAKQYAITEMRQISDAIDPGADDPYGETYAENLTSEAEDLNLEDGPDWSCVVDVGGAHGIPEAWWITCETMQPEEAEAVLNADYL